MKHIKLFEQFNFSNEKSKLSFECSKLSEGNSNNPNLQDVKNYYLDFIKNHPEFKSEANDYYQLMLDEIDNGESLDNEIYLFKSSCEQLLNDDDN